MNQQNFNTGIPDIPDKNVLVFGCGNILLSDDGFGPRVAEELLKNYHLPGNVGVINAGTSVRNILFDIALSEKKPEKIIIIDAIDAGKTPGEIFELPIDEIPEKKIDDFSMHQLPTSNLLKELKDLCKVDVIIIACQVENIPTEVSTTISKKLIDAIPEVCKRIIELIKNS
jgi:coenzyme F420 hydrogenase subunit delta